MLHRIVRICVCLIGLTLYSQECENTFQGYIIDFHDGAPLASATISIDTQTYRTDSNGFFKVEGLCDQTYLLTAAHEDCNSKVFSIQPSRQKSQTFYLEHHTTDLDIATITSRKHISTTSSVKEDYMDAAQVRTFSGATLGDALKTINGVSTLQTGTSIQKPVIQGLSGSRVTMINQNVRMQDMEWGDEHAPNIDINSAGSISVLKGASALKYGSDAIGGIVVLNPKELISKKDTLFGYSTLSGRTNGRGGSGTLSITKQFEQGYFLRAHGTYKKYGDSEAPDYVLSNTGLEEFSGSLETGFRTFERGWDAYYSYYDAEIGILRSSHIGNVDGLIRAINRSEPFFVDPFTYAINPPSQKVRHHLARLRFYQRFESLGKLSFQYDYQMNNRLEFDIRRGENRGRASLDLDLQTHSATVDFVYDAKEQLRIEAGILGRYQNNFADPSTRVRRLIPDYELWDMGAYLSGKYDFSESLHFDAGIRMDYRYLNAQKWYQIARFEERGYDEDFGDIVVREESSQILLNPEFEFLTGAATTGLYYSFGEALDLRFNYTYAQRVPNPAELFSEGLHHSAARVEIGDLRIDPERSHKFSLSFAGETDFLQWNVAPYLHAINDYILLEPESTEQTNRGAAFPEWEYRQTDALLIGFDTQIGLQWAPSWSSTHNLSMLNGKEVEGDIPIINIPPTQTGHKLQFSKEDWNTFTASLGYTYHFQKKNVPENIQVFSPLTGEQIELAINDAPEGYGLLDFSSSVAFPLGPKNKIQLRGSITNLMNISYRAYLNRQRFFADDVARNFLIQVTYTF